MNTNNKGFAPIAIVLIIVAGIVVIGAGFYAYHLQNKGRVADTNTTTTLQGPMLPATTSTSTPSSSASVSPTKKFPIYPTSGPVGATITINGSGFATTGNVVTMNGLTAASLKDLPSADGKTIKFIVPQTLGPNCKSGEMCAQYLVDVATGTTYDVSVISNGVIEEVGPFTVSGGVIH